VHSPPFILLARCPSQSCTHTPVLMFFKYVPFSNLTAVAVPTIQEEHSKWLGSVLPKDEDQISINTSEYIEKFGSTQQGQGTNTSETVTIKRPSGSCPGPMEHSLKCAFDSCAQTDLWPKACCPAIDCKNGGTLDYVGICFCRCKIPFVGVYCAEEASQVCNTM
jgi:hypothetical protein